MNPERRSRTSVGIALFLGLFLCLGPFSDAQSPVADPDTLRLWEALDFLRKGGLLEAVGAFQELSTRGEKPETRARSLVLMGDIYGLFLDDRDRALQNYTEAVERYPSLPETANAYFNLGMIHFEQNRMDRSVLYFEEYLRRYPLGSRTDSARFMLDTARSSLERQARLPEPVVPEPPAEKPPPETVEKPPVPAPIPATPAPPPVVPEAELPRLAVESPLIRVLIVSDAPSVRLVSDAPIELEDPERPGGVLKRPAKAETVLRPAGRNVTVEGVKFEGGRLEVRPARSGALIRCQDRRFRGSLLVSSTAKGQLEVVNILPMEEYLYSVVPKEMPASWPPEALKAQAVAARTYGLFMVQKNSGAPYDVVSTTMSQVYGGADAEHESSVRAVDGTRGEVLTYSEKPILAYFHSNSGGKTTDAGSVWSADVPYLKSVVDPYSEKAPGLQWEQTLDFGWVRVQLNKQGYRIGEIRSIEVAGRDSSGRAESVRIRHSGGDTVISGNQLRLKLGATRLKSTLFQLNQSASNVTFKGKGYGHGVGMSQWGAYQMAAEGHDYKSILRHYYGPTRLARAM